MKKILISIIFLITAFYLNNVALAIEPNVKAPENFDEAKRVGEKTFNIAKNDLPGIISNIWKNEVWPVWKKMGEYVKNFWNIYLKTVWQKFKNIFQKEIDVRKPIINEEFKKEKTELKEGLKTEVPTAGKSIWEKIKEIIQ